MSAANLRLRGYNYEINTRLSVGWRQQKGNWRRLSPIMSAEVIYFVELNVASKNEGWKLNTSRVFASIVGASGGRLLNNPNSKNMYYVYIIQAINTPTKFYVGSSHDVCARLAKHNEGGSVYTKDYKPWKLVWYSSFQERSRALEFEKYLKTYSGKAFMEKRLT